MTDPRHRTILIIGVGLSVTWLLVWGVYRWTSQAKVTAEKVAFFVDNLDLGSQPADQRARALQALIDKINRLDPEERRKVRLGRKLEPAFQQMSEEEKARLIEATMPTGLKQMITAFGEMPEDRRQRAITNAVERLRRDRDALFPAAEEADRPPLLSQELQEKVVRLGLKTFYEESSAQTKAELAPLLEELQRSMERGRFLRGNR